MSPPGAQAADLVPANSVDLAFHRWRDRTNGVIGLECEFAGRLDELALRKACELLLDVEPVLAYRLDGEPSRPRWVRLPARERTVFTVADREDAYEALRCTRLDETRGPQLAVCLRPRGAGDRLLVKLAHLVGDGVSLQLLVARLAALYSSLLLDPTCRPRPRGLKPRDPREILASVPRLVRLGALVRFALFMAPRLRPRGTHRLPLPQQPAGPWRPVVRHVRSPSLSFVATYGKERGATVNDVFLAAAYRALAAEGWDGASGLRIVITVDLRRWCLPPEHATTIANLSAWDCPYLVRDLGRSFDETLARVSALTRRRKDSRPGLALALVALRLLARLESAHPRSAPRGSSSFRGRSASGAALTLSNEGLLDDSHLRFGEETPIRAHVLPPAVPPPSLQVCLSGYDGGFTLAAVTAENGLEPVGRFLDALLGELPAGATADRRRVGREAAATLS